MIRNLPFALPFTCLPHCLVLRCLHFKEEKKHFLRKFHSNVLRNTIISGNIGILMESFPHALWAIVGTNLPLIYSRPLQQAVGPRKVQAFRISNSPWRNKMSFNATGSFDSQSQFYISNKNIMKLTHILLLLSTLSQMITGVITFRIYTNDNLGYPGT